MTESQGMIAGALLALALFVYTFWPENVFASQREKTRLDYLLERKEQLTKTCAISILSTAPGNIPRKISPLSAPSSKTKPRSSWPKSNSSNTPEESLHPNMGGPGLAFETWESNKRIGLCIRA